MIRILIVDDHILFREGLKAIISSEKDFEIAGLAGSVQEATELAHILRPDVVLMDFSLPDGSGADATRAILADQPQCKILFLTISEKEDDLIMAVRAGAKGFVFKNISPSKLGTAIRDVQNGESALSPAMTLLVMEALARTKPADRLLDPRLAKLTEREMDVFKELAAGSSNQEIGEHLFLAENTVKFHVHSIFAKLNINTRKDVVYIAQEFGATKTHRCKNSVIMSNYPINNLS
jgi:DNA-binding NarL/FixJ family response regulator